MNLRKLKNQAGFTLVELIVVIAIMAILAGVAVPVYSGYIAKAEKAGDLQLLDAVNSAFAAACVEGGADVYAVTDATLTYASAEKGAAITGIASVSGDGLNAAVVQEAFARYYAGNTGSVLKSTNKLNFNKTTHLFEVPGEVVLSAAQQAVLDYLKETYGDDGGKIDQYLESTFNTKITEGELLGQVDWVTGLATEAMTEDSVLYNIVNDPTYIAGMMTSVGLNPESEEDQAKFMGMATNEDGSLKQSFLANSLVLNVAQNTAGNPAMGKDTLASQLANGSIKGTISGNLKDDPETGLAQAAVAYGMYTAYANYIGDQEMINNASNMSSLSNLTTMLNDMYGKQPADGKPTFEQYMAGQGAADLDGYLAALEMAGAAAGKDPDLTLDVLNNGFGGLEGVLGSLEK